MSCMKKGRQAYPTWLTKLSLGVVAAGGQRSKKKISEEDRKRRLSSLNDGYSIWTNPLKF